MARRAAATGYHTPEAAARAAADLEEALAILEGESSESAWALRLPIAFLLVEVRLEQQRVEVCREGMSVDGELAAALRRLDAQPVELCGRPLKELRALRDALDARVVRIHDRRRGEYLLTSAMRSLSEADAVELAALAWFHLLRFHTVELPSGPGAMSSDFLHAVRRQVVSLLDRANGAEQRLAGALEALFQPPEKPRPNAWRTGSR
ncbi:MAG: hypothetical protein GY856_11980, partial [bacterium]|nr:hypothetical protein [bacterium]